MDFTAGTRLGPYDITADFGAMAREEMGKWYSPDLVEHLVDGLRKAGLQIADDVALEQVVAKP